MAGYVEKGRILTHELVGPSIWRMRLELPLIAKDAKPGQFIHVKVNDPTCILRRPISIAGTEPGKGILEIIYRIVGKGTHAQLMESCPAYQEIARSQLSQKELNLQKEGE